MRGLAGTAFALSLLAKARVQRLWRSSSGGKVMLMWALFFFIIAVIAGIFGFGVIETVAMDLAKILFFLFIVIAVVLLLLGVFAFGSIF
jgi:uncharacterized membrane protein YtjA (UPF0391 family)